MPFCDGDKENSLSAAPLRRVRRRFSLCKGKFRYGMRGLVMGQAELRLCQYAPEVQHLRGWGISIRLDWPCSVVRNGLRLVDFFDSVR